MKLNRLISFTILGTVIVGSFGFMTKTEAETDTKKYSMIDMEGSRLELGDVKIENIIQTAPRTFEKMTISKNDIAYKPTKYDDKYGADELVLDNKDLFRGKHHSPKLETDTSLMSIGFNPKFPYASQEAFITVDIKDKKTGNITKNKVTVNGMTSNQYIRQESIFTLNNETYFLVNASEHSSNSEEYTVKLFKVDTDKATLTEVINYKVPSKEWKTHSITNFASDNVNLYALASGEQKAKLVIFNPATGNVDVKDIPFTLNTFIDGINVNEKYITLNSSEGIYIIDKKTLVLVNEEPLTSIAVPTNTDRGYHTNDALLKDNKLYTINMVWNENHTPTNYIVVYDLEMKKMAYQGKLPTLSFGYNYTLTK